MSLADYTSFPDAVAVAIMIAAVASVLSAFLPSQQIGAIKVPDLCQSRSIACRVGIVFASVVVFTGLYVFVSLDVITEDGLSIRKSDEMRAATFAKAQSEYEGCVIDACSTGGAKTPLTASNISARQGDFSASFLRFTQNDRSSNCSVNYRVGWRASPEHFFFVPAGVDLATVSKNGGGSSRVVPDNLGSGLPSRAVQTVDFDGEASKSRKFGKRFSCGVEIALNVVHLPEICRSILVAP